MPLPIRELDGNRIAAEPASLLRLMRELSLRMRCDGAGTAVD